MQELVLMVHLSNVLSKFKLNKAHSIIIYFVLLFVYIYIIRKKIMLYIQWSNLDNCQGDTLTMRRDVDTYLLEHAEYDKSYTCI